MKTNVRSKPPSQKASALRALFSAMILACCLTVACKKSETPKVASASGDFMTLMNVGKSQFEKGDSAEAIATFEKAVAMQPTSIDARLDLANAYLLAGQPVKVLEQTAQVIDMDPMSGGARYLAGCAYLRLQKFTEALKSLQQAKDIDRTVNEVSFQLGLAYEGLKNNEEAETQWRETIEFGPEHPSAYYRLSQILLRSGNTDEAQEMLERHQEVIVGKTIPSDPSFLEQSIYTRMRVPFVLAQPAVQGIDVQYVEVTDEWVPKASNYSGPIGLVDFNRIGQPGLFVLEDNKQFRLLEFTNGQFAAAGGAVPARPDGGYQKVLVGDLDNDRFDDIIVLGTGQSHVIKVAADARMSDRTMLTGLAQLKATDGALADLDFTSKLGLAVALPNDEGLRFYRNLGNVMFKEDTAAIGFDTTAFPAKHVTVADWNKDDLPDVLALGGGGVRFYANQRGGKFVLTNSPASWPSTRGILIHDFNNDLRWDAAFLASGNLEIAFGGLTNRVVVDTQSTAATGFISTDFDNDGWLDLIAFGGGGMHAWRNEGERGFSPVKLGFGTTAAKQVMAADLDNDCDTDIVLITTDGALKIFRNDGGNQNRMMKFKAVGNRSNGSGIGARFELTAGDWHGMRAVTQSPLEIGVGPHQQIDSVFIQWSQMRMNLEAVSTTPCRVSVVTEVVQMQMTSCPYLYKWNGTTFEFVSDFLSAAPMGLPAAPGHIIAADPEELLWVGTPKTFPAMEGRYVLKMTEELSEVLYLDEVKLVAVDHPVGTKVFSTSKLLPGKPWLPHEIVTMHQQVSLKNAIGTDGENVTLLLAEIDGLRFAPRRFGDHLMGYAEPSQLTLDFGALDSTKPLVLALNGWLRFGGAMGNVAASQNPDLPFPFPTLEVETADGKWLPVDVRAGAPAGRTKSIIIDLNGKLPVDAKRLRLSYAFDMYWDQVALYEKAGEANTTITTVPPAGTDLQYRGFSVTEKHDWTHPTTPIHDQLAKSPLVPKVPSGWVTRYGAADELVAEKDNAFVLINGGDALTIEFDAAQFPEVPDGFERDLFVWSVGWDKDTDYHTVAGDRIEPLPWHGMDDQLYGAEERPAFESDELMDRYNTRWASPRVPVQKQVARE